jgi:hypothetical protein
MGVQSAAVVRLDVPGFSSTYLTSTYIRAIGGLVTGGREHVAPKLLALCAALAGAVVGAVILSAEPRWVPAFALALLAIVGTAGTLLSGPGRPLGASSAAPSSS